MKTGVKTTQNQSRWKTLSRRDPEFLAYLDGSFSVTHLALPVSSLNVGTAREEVTFEIRDGSDVQTPSFFKTALQMIRPSSLFFSRSDARDIFLLPSERFNFKRYDSSDRGQFICWRFVFSHRCELTQRLRRSYEGPRSIAPSRWK